jgi:hypothetical protein
MAYILKQSSGGGGGDATADNQQSQIDQLTEVNPTPSVLKDNTNISVFKNATQRSVFVEDGSLDSVFKDSNNESTFNISNSSVFKGRGNVKVFTDATNISAFVTTDQQSILYKTFINDRSLSVRPNTILCASFTAVTAAGVTTLLNNFLSANNVAINSMTSSQSVGSHDLFLLYSVL